MSVKVEKLENNMVKLTVTIDAEKVESQMQSVYMRNKNRFSVPGFRKGKAPRKMIENRYGTGVFFEDAVNDLLPYEYSAAVEESGMDVVSEPEIDFEQTEPGKDVIFTAVAAVKPEIVLGQYKGVEVTKPVIEVTDDDVMNVLEMEQKKNAVKEEVTDRPVKDGDHTEIDFEGFTDGVAFSGGKGEDYPLTIGSNAFIPGFESQLIGAEIGKEVEVNVTFPEDYHAEDLKGKDALFKVTVKKIEEEKLPELNDEFASMTSEYETLEEYKDSIKKHLTAKKISDAQVIKENEAIGKVIENSQMDVPQAMIDSEAKSMLREMGSQMERSGLTLEKYMEYVDMTEEQMLAQLSGRALQRIQTRLVLEAVAKAENFEITQEEIDAEYGNIANMYQMEIEKIKEISGEEQENAIREEISYRKAGAFVRDEAVEVDAPADEASDAE